MAAEVVEGSEDIEHEPTQTSHERLVSFRGAKGVLSRLTQIGQAPDDPSSLRARKSLLVVVSLMVLPAAVLWGALYWIFDERVAALFPWFYFVASVGLLIIFSATRSYTFLRTGELGLILLVPFVLSLSLGGLVPSSGVILWSFLAPVGAVVFDRPRRAWAWFVAFVVLIAAIVPLAPLVRPDPVSMPPSVVLAFLGLNVVGVAAVSFTLLVLFARQRELAQHRVEELLANILPAEIAERLQDRRQSIADHYEQASVLFADVVDFTPMSSGLPPSSIVGLLDELFSEFDGLVDRYDLEKIKTIGDAYMVASGVPTPRADHAQALAGAAIEMRDLAAHHVRADDGRAIELRIGINSGPVVAGVIGRRRFLFDLWGDTVNVASRMESHGLPGQIRITRATWELIRDEFECEPIGTVELKGKGEVEAWSLERARAGASVGDHPG